MAGNRIAVIDLGTNSTRLLVAEVADGQVQLELAAEVGRVARRRLADQDEAEAGGLELLPVAVQLNRVLAAVDSAVVAEPDERDGALAPELAEPYVVPVVVEQDDVGERVGALRRMGLLALFCGPEHVNRVPP